MAFSYHIPDKRELTEEERRLLRFLLTGKHALESQIDRLKVVARCGCGRCPTIYFGESLGSEPLTHVTKVVDYCGLAANGTTVGVTLTEQDGKLARLEAWAVDVGDVEEWPPIEAPEVF